MRLESITLRNILSFKDVSLALEPLNVLIGPNAVGKSNLIDAISLLQAAPTDLNGAILRGGGARQWIWRGEGGGPAYLSCRVCYDKDFPPAVYEYLLTFAEAERTLLIQQEYFESLPHEKREVYFDRFGGRLALGESLEKAAEGKIGTIPGAASVLSTFKNPLDPTPITRLGREFERIRVYKEFNTGPMGQARTGVSAGAANKEFLEDGGNNLALVLLEMIYDGSIGRLNEYLPRVCEQFENVRASLDGGIVRVAVKEQGLSEPTPSVRLSDGTLKFLCLLAILVHPKPPSLICIEEPELGLHPDALRLVAEALVEASQRTQLIVTTHSVDLINALSDQPEAVVVCERDFDNGTYFRRLNRDHLGVWLQRYKLGELWRKGEIGGNRW